MKKFKELYAWVVEGRFPFLILFLLTGVILITYIDIGLSPVHNIKIYGLLLQIIGAVTIINSLRKRLILFKGHGISFLFKNWLRKFPFFQKGRIHNIKATLRGTGSISVKGDKLIKSPDKNNPGDIIRYFDEKIEDLKKRIIDTEDRLTSELFKVNCELDSTRSSLTDKLDENRKIIEDSTLSNVWHDLIGVSSIIMGLIFSTIPELIIIIIP